MQPTVDNSPRFSGRQAAAALATRAPPWPLVKATLGYPALCIAGVQTRPPALTSVPTHFAPDSGLGALAKVCRLLHPPVRAPLCAVPYIPWGRPPRPG